MTKEEAIAEVKRAALSKTTKRIILANIKADTKTEDFEELVTWLLLAFEQKKEKDNA